MKPIILKTLLLTLTGLASTNFGSACVIGDYKWSQMAEKQGCFSPNCKKGQFPMAIVPIVAFDGKLYSIGDKAVWTSADGINWSSQPKTDWGERAGLKFAFFKNQLWMLGGMKSWDDFRNDVWSSSDGRNWRQTISNAKWSPRRNHGVIVFKNRLWILGGAESSGRSDQTPTKFLNDVWNSEDGVNWNQVTANAPWAARNGHLSLVFDDKGGEGFGDVWSSTDGKNWTQVTAKAEWTARGGNGGLVFDGKMWIFGGVGFNDVWRSSDGKHWHREFANAPWSTRSTVCSIVFNHRLWIFSGKTGRKDSWDGNVWAMSRNTVARRERYSALGGEK